MRDAAIGGEELLLAVGFRVRRVERGLGGSEHFFFGGSEQHR